MPVSHPAAHCQDSQAHHKCFHATLTAATWNAVQTNSSGFLAVRSTDAISTPLSEMEILFPLLHYRANLPLHHSIPETEGVPLYSTYHLLGSGVTSAYNRDHYRNFGLQ